MLPLFPTLDYKAIDCLSSFTRLSLLMSSKSPLIALLSRAKPVVCAGIPPGQAEATLVTSVNQAPLTWSPQQVFTSQGLRLFSTGSWRDSNCPSSTVERLRQQYTGVFVNTLTFAVRLYCMVICRLKLCTLHIKRF